MQICCLYLVEIEDNSSEMTSFAKLLQNSILKNFYILLIKIIHQLNDCAASY